MTEKVKSRIRDSYGVNMTISGDYDQSLSARCENGVLSAENQIAFASSVEFRLPSLRWEN